MISKPGKILIVIGILILFSFAILCVPAYMNSAHHPGQGKEKTLELNESQLEIANDLWGSNITVGEFYDKVCPEYLDTMPEELRLYLFTVKMEWP